MAIKRLYRKPVKKVARRRPQPKKQLVTKQQLYKAINKNIETKKSFASYPLTSFNSGINSVSDLLTVIPPINLGTSEDERIGGQINPVKLVIKGYITYACDVLDSVTNIQAKIILGRLFLFQDKAIRQYGNSSAVNLNLLDTGGSPGFFNGFAIEWEYPKNTQQHTFYKDMKFKVLKPYGQITNATSTSSIMAMNSTMHRSFTITLTKKQLPAKFLYDENSGSTGSFPTNFAPYMGLGYANAAGYAPDSTATQIKMQYTTTLYYKDA